MAWLPNSEDMFIRFDATHEHDRQTDRRTPHAGIYRAIASRGKNYPIFMIFYTAADFELDERNVIKNEKKSCIGQTPSSTERISCN